MTITPMTKPPQEVLDIVAYTQACACRSEYYESLTPIAWVNEKCQFKARRALDRFYQERTKLITTSKGTFKSERTTLTNSCADLSRGNPIELHVGNWWILCGFNFD